MAISTDTDLTPFQQFLEECRQEYEQTQSDLKEIELLIQQTTAEVDRLAQRNTHVTNRLRHVEASLDTVPREDIQEAYSIVLDTQQRLFTLRGQLEKLQSDQRKLGRHLDLLRRLLEVSGQAKDYEPETPEEEVEPAQALVVRIIEAQERERRRLSRQMHDGPAQALTNLILQAEICERLFDADPQEARAELANLKDAVAATFEKLRGFIFNLRPMMLDDLGLVPTLRRYADTFSKNTGVAIHLSTTGEERRLAPYKEVTAFRIVQELLNNAHEYGHASSVNIHLDMGAESKVRVSVEDDGTGFQVPEAADAADGGRLGLATMRERVGMLGGDIQFESAAERGTKASLRLPVSLSPEERR